MRIFKIPREKYRHTKLHSTTKNSNTKYSAMTIAIMERTDFNKRMHLRRSKKCKLLLMTVTHDYED